MKTIIILVIAGMVAYTAFDMVRQFMAESGNVEDRLKAAFRHSKVLFIQRLTQLGVGGLAVAAFAGDAIGLPGVTETAKSWIGETNWPVFVAVLSMMNELARRIKPGTPS